MHELEMRSKFISEPNLMVSDMWPSHEILTVDGPCIWNNEALFSIISLARTLVGFCICGHACNGVGVEDDISLKHWEDRMDSVPDSCCWSNE